MSNISTLVTKEDIVKKHENTFRSFGFRQVNDLVLDLFEVNNSQVVLDELQSLQRLEEVNFM